MAYNSEITGHVVNYYDNAQRLRTGRIDKVTARKNMLYYIVSGVQVLDCQLEPLKRLRKIK